MEKKVKCPWCSESTEGKVNRIKSDYANVVERRCTRCEKILASYLEGEGDFLPKIRVFDNA